MRPADCCGVTSNAGVSISAIGASVSTVPSRISSPMFVIVTCSSVPTPTGIVPTSIVVSGIEISGSGTCTGTGSKSHASGVDAGSGSGKSASGSVKSLPRIEK